MLDNLQNAENRYEELTQMLTDPGIINNQEMYRKYITEHSELSIIVETFKNYKEAKASRDEARSLLDGTLEPDFRELVQSEYDDNCEKMKNFEKELTILLTPKDPRDFKNVIVEIRGGAGGEEAALFSYSLFRMYKMYAERKGWRTEILDINETELGGLKEVVFNVIGNGAYSRFKFESGVHRVQRVPDTESSGRIHTSTATVAVLPEVDDVDVQININDLEINTYRSGGAGGQHINKTDSAIRITHKPSGLVVTCQNERSQLKNKEKAMAVLRSRLYEMYESQQTNDLAMQRKNQVGSGDRSEKIRTYNYPQNRVSDHRINYTSHRLFDVLNGDLDELIDALITTNQTEKLISGDAGYED